MSTTNSGTIAGAVAGLSAGFFLALVATASPAHADPVAPVVPAPPVVVALAPSAPNVQAAGTDAAPLPAAAGPAPTVQAAGADAVPLPPEGVPHLASPDALPPGSTMVPQDPNSPNVSYLRDLWQAVQNHEISGKEALVMGLAQRGMNTPYPDQAPGPNVPIGPGDPGPAPAPAGPILSALAPGS